MGCKILYSKEGKGILAMERMDYVHPSLPVHNQEFFEKLKHDISLNGLRHPLVALPITIRAWKEMREITPALLPPPEGDDDAVVLQIRCGNNRWYAAKELGYDIIEIKRVYSLAEGSKECVIQRKS